MDFHDRFVEFLPELKKALTVEGTTDWSVKGFIDTYRNIYSITTDTKVISKVIEIMIFPYLLRFAKENNLKIRLPPHQNYYPDVTFIDSEGNKYAIDLKTTYRITDDSVNGMTLGAFTGYFRNRSSYKNALFPYEVYKKHYVLGVIYSRSDIDSITNLLIEKGFKLTSSKRKLLITYMNNADDDNWNLLASGYSENISEYRSQIDSYLVDELESYTLDNFEGIVSVARRFEFFFQEKWKLAVDRPGSGNTKNIGSETLIKRLMNGEGLFFREYGDKGEVEFDKYWMQYQTKDMARILGQDEPIYKNLQTFKLWLLSLQKT
ncbi:type II restriction endonuclease [Enterobacter sp. ENT03]|uniref:type II restriction endonuclease n=1 Tax=Enterobacter sp. ENT03 TaxID=2854780 RepID=UPI001C446D54|nr:type II restriction endonuclease [Enterobacter sp. ENT03]MBV7405492.1 hypothetical protein [Enterobacter sp. ENT03]